jgi:hypothetical protein
MYEYIPPTFSNYLFRTQCVYEFYTLLRINSDYFPNSINQFSLCNGDRRFVFFAVGTEFIPVKSLVFQRVNTRMCYKMLHIMLEIGFHLSYFSCLSITSQLIIIRGFSGVLSSIIVFDLQLWLLIKTINCLRPSVT